MWVYWPITFSSFSIQNLVRTNCMRSKHLLNIFLLSQLHSKNCLHFLKAKLFYMHSAMVSLHFHFCLLYNQLKHHHILAFFFVEESKTDLAMKECCSRKVHKISAGWKPRLSFYQKSNLTWFYFKFKMCFKFNAISGQHFFALCNRS